MRRMTQLSALALSLVAPHALGAQDPGRLVQDVRAPVFVQTFNLRWISSIDAAQLVSPYVQGENTGAFSAGPNMHAITVRGTKAMMARVDSVLRENDRQPPTIVLRFQLIAGLDSAATRDPAIADVDAALRGLFRFGGYKLLAQGATSVSESSQFLVSMSSGSEHYKVEGTVHGVRTTGRSGSADLNVGLVGPGGVYAVGNDAAASRLFSTGMTVPIGQTIVLGTGSGGSAGKTLILTVHTELAPPASP
jgi:hypothetical protein